MLKFKTFLVANPQKKLDNVAYTLQMDREAMEHRLCFSATNSEDAISKISIYLKDNVENNAAENIFYSSIKKTLGEDENENATIENALKCNDADRLAAAWVKGANINWAKLYPNAKPLKISLPEYPFAKERYWFDTSANDQIKVSVETIKATTTEETKSIQPTVMLTEFSTAINQPDGKIKLADLTSENDSFQIPIYHQEPLLKMSHQIITPEKKAESHFDDLATIDTLKSLVKEALYITEDIDEDKTFLELGLDSITGVELVKSVNTQFNIKVEVTKLYDYPSIKTLANYIGEQLAPVLNEAVKVEVKPAKETIATPNVTEKIAVEPIVLKTPVPVIQTKLVPLPIVAEKTDNRIAIIGMSGRYPKSENLEVYWDNISAGKDCVEEVPSSRWNVNEWYKKDGEKTGDIYSKWLGSLADVDKFDPLFFNMTPAEAELMDPQHRIFLQECWKSLEDAGYTRSQLDGKNCGTYVGIMVNEYGDLLRRSGSTINPAQFMTGNSISIFAARLAYLLNLKGPAIAIDTACSSSLVCIHLACQALWNNEIDMALAGGVTLYLGVEPYKQMSAAGMLAKDGACKTFDNAADGFVPGEGAGVVVLKRLSDALKDGDEIKGVILGSGINQDGKTNGITAPSANAQTALLQDVYTKFFIDPATISYVEAHGTGTKIGDPIEVEALTTAFRLFTQKKDYCGLGSVKSNLGHTSAAAGVAGLHKLLLQMRHGKLVPTIHFTHENEHLHLADSPFFITTNLKEWEKENDQPRRAALSSFGFSGTNAHLVVEEFQSPNKNRYVDNNAALFVLSAKNSDRLKEQVSNLLAYLDANVAADIFDIAYTLQTAREAMDERLALLTNTIDELVFKLANYLQGNTSKLFTGNAKKDKTDFTLKGGAGKAYINYAIENRETESLAQLWVKGVNIDWALLYPTNKPNKISLPTYPFEKRRCWFTVVENIADSTINQKIVEVFENKAAELYSLGANIASNNFEEEYLSFCPFEKKMPGFSMTKIFLNPNKFPEEKAFMTARQIELRQVLFCKENFGSISKVFDFGCGHGTDVIQLAKQYPHIQTIGFTITKSQVEVGNGRIKSEGLEKQAHIYHKDSSTDKMPANCDLVIGIEVSCHISNKKGLFQNLANAVSENGHLLLMDFITNMRGSIVDPAVEISIATSNEWVAILSSHHLVIDEIIDVSPQIANFMYDPEFEQHIKDLPKVAQDSFRNYVNCSSSLEKGWISYCLFKIRKDSNLTEQDLKHINTQKINTKTPYANALKDMLQSGNIPYPKPNGNKFNDQNFQSLNVLAPQIPQMETAETNKNGSLRFFETNWNNIELTQQKSPIGKTIIFSNGSSDLLINKLRYLLGETEIITSSNYAVDLKEIIGLIDLTPLEDNHNGSNYEWIKPVQQLIDNGKNNSLKLLIVSTIGNIKGAERFGLYQTLRAEYAKAESLHIEIENGLEIENQHRLIVEAYRSETIYTKLRHANGTWQSPILKEQKNNPANEISITGPILISGGTRGIGMICAKHLVEKHGVKQLVLLGKDELPKKENWETVATENTVQGKKIKDILYLEACGAEVQILTTSLSDKKALANDFAAITKNWGAIKGVLHCAGYTDLKTPAFIRKSVESVEAIQSVKALALNNLHELLNSENELDFTVLCSSVSSLVPKLGVGFSDYVMANTYMDAFAQFQRNKGYNYTSIQWPNWKETGMGEIKGGIYEELGLVSISNQQGTQILDAVLSNKSLSPVVFPAICTEKFDESKLLTVPKKVVFKPKKQVVNNLPTINQTTGKDIATVENELTVIFQSVLKLEKEDLAGIDNFSELGIDSINVVELIEVVNRHFNLNLPTSVLFTFGTMEQLANYIQHELPIETPSQTNNANVFQPITNIVAPTQIVEETAVKNRLQAEWGNKSKVENKLADLFQTVLKLEITDLEGIDNFSELGIDSINVVELVETINRTFSLNLPTSVLFTFGTMEQLADYIANSLAEIPALVETENDVLAITETPNISPTEELAISLNKNLDNNNKYIENEVVINKIMPQKSSDFLPTNNEKDDIAIIGLSCRSAGADDKVEFWNLIKEGEDWIEDVEDKEWLSFFENHCNNKNKIRYGAIKNSENFDAAFFNISSKEAELMDVTQRILLEECYKALEDAGYAPSALANQPVGTFIGAMDSIPKTDDMSHFSMLGSENSILAGRVAHFLNLKGIALTLNTACSSSVVAMDLAISKLKSGEINLGICGGITVYTHPAAFVSMSNAGMLSPTGECRPFDNEANGIVVGDGVGVVILKRLSEAQKDGDHIYGVIRGTGTNQNGKTLSITVPSHLAQSELIESVYRRNGIDVNNIQYVESHGTATKLGDPAEIHGLTHAFSQFTNKKHFCSIGSLKANIGHTTAAAGVLGVIKVLLGFQHQQIPPSIHFEMENEHIDFSNSPVVVNTHLKNWPVNANGNRLAAVSSFGFSGNNTHLVLEQFNQKAKATSIFGEPAIIVLSAKNAERLKAKAADLRDFLEISPTTNLYDFAYTLQLGRDAMEERLAFVANNLTEIKNQLTHYLNNTVDSFFTGNSRKDKADSLKESSKAVINSAIENKAFDSLAQLWAKGATINWALLYKAAQINKISLPTYPFAKEKYQFDGAKKRKNVIASRNLAQPAQPVLLASQPEVKLLQPIMPLKAASVVGNGKIVLSDIGSNLPATTIYPEKEKIHFQNISFKNETKTITKADKKAILTNLKQLLKEALYLETDVEEDRAFVELGLDSITGVELMKNVNESFGIKLEATKLYDYPTLQTLSVYIAETIAETPSGMFTTAYEIVENETQEESITEETIEKETAKAPTEIDSSLVLNDLKELLKETLYFEGEMEEDRAFVEFGLDSITGVELMKSINEHFGLKLEAMRLYDYPTLATLAAFISEQSATVSTNTQVDKSVEKELSDVFIQSTNDGEISIVTNNKIIAVNEETIAITNENTKTDDRIAIIGMSGRYPKSENLDAYWNNISAGKDCVEEVPANRWKVEDYYKKGGEQTGDIYSKWLGSLTNIDQFDPAFFNISPVEAELMDPHHRIFMQECWKSLEDAGYTRQLLDGKNCGTYIGIVGNEYGHKISTSGMTENLAQFMTGNSASIFSARLAYLLNLKGPAIAIDTACSSSLVCIHLACQALWNNEIDMALAGGVTLYLGVEPYKQMSAAAMLSKEGKCKTFDNSADGFVPGEGAGVVVLKRLMDALKDGDEIKGIILGSGINQDGKTNGITAPSVNSQTALIKDIYSKYAIDPATISYVEAHGTGTKIGDPIEVEALTKAFRSFTQKANYCGLGSVKSNLGHTSAAAGVAGLHKLLLQMRNNQLAPTIHFNHENEHLHLADSPFYINASLKEWKKENGQPRRAALSSFGFSGTNAHLVVEEYQPINKNRYADDKPALVVLSAKNGTRLKAQVENIKNYVETNADVNIYDIAYTLQAGRETMEERLALVVKNKEELITALNDYLNDITGKAFTGNTRNDKIEEMLAGQSETEMVATSIKNSQFETIAQLWVKGAVINWALLYKKIKPQKISLPTYPFAKESYWVKEQIPFLASANQLHPLLHTNESDLKEQKYSSVYTGKESFLADHKVGKEKILPGVAYLELAREAGERSTRKKVTQLTDVSWLSPMMVNGTPQKVEISLVEAGETIAYEVYTQKNNNQQIHNRGSLNSTPVQSPVKKDLTAIKNRLTAFISGEECYSLFKTKELNYGASFQGIETLFYSAEEALSKISLPKEQGYILAPGLLDSALQTCAGLSFNQQEIALELPFSVKEVTMYKDLPQTFWCYAVKSVGQKTNGKVTNYHIDLLAENGEVLIRFKDFATLPINGGIKSAVSAIAFNELRVTETAVTPITHQKVDFLYAPVWERSKITATNFNAGNYVLVTGNADEATIKDFQHIILNKNAAVETVIELKEISANATHVCLLQGLAKPNKNNTLQQNVEQNELAVFNAIKTLLASDFKNQALNITVVTSNTQQVLSTDKVSVIGSGISGFMGSLAKEQPLWKIGVIDVEADNLDKTIIEKVLETPLNKEETLTSFRKGQRYERTLYPVNLQRQANSKLKQGGTYVLLGGAGGLGKVTTAHLVKNYQAQVIWLGRSQLNEAIAQSQNEIEKLGIRPIYIACDATDDASMQHAYQEIKLAYPVINGLFHSAIVLNDMLVKNMDETDFNRSFAPKSFAGHHFVETFKNEHLDFICFYSSVQSQINAPGQSNYSAGCTYKDSYAHSLKHSLKTPVHIINWGYWGETGIVSSNAYNEKMRLFGIGSISPAEGMQALETVLSNSKTQLVAIKLLY